MKRVLPLLLLILGFLSITPDTQAQIPGLPNRWNSISMSPLDTGRVAAACFTVGGKSYVIGGDTSEAFGAYKRWTRDVWCYTHATNSWSRVADFPGDIRLGAVAFGATSLGKGYYGLGYADTGWLDTFFQFNPSRMDIDTFPYYNQKFYKDWWEYDTASNAWTQKNDFPVANYFDALTLANTQFGIANASGFSIDTSVKVNGGTSKYYAGGFMWGEHWLMSLDSLTAANAPWPGVKWDGWVKQVFNRTPYFYDPAADNWTAGPMCPGIGRSNAVAMVIDGNQDVVGRNPKLYAGMGDNDAYNIVLLGIYLKDWYSYDFATNSWAQERSLPDTGKTTAGSFGYEHLGFIVGGFDGEWSKRFFVYHTSDEDWQRYPDYRDSGRSLGVAFVHGNRGHYGAGFRGLSEEMETFSWWTIDTNTIRVNSYYAEGDTFCAGSEIKISWRTGFNFTPGATMRLQVSDKDGIFEWPISAKSDMGTYTITSNYDSITAELPLQLDRGGEYRLRVISSSPTYISRQSNRFFVKDNPNFTYVPKVHPFIDTVCINSDFFIPSFTTGSIDSVGKFSYHWMFNGDTLAGQKDDTLKISSIDYSNQGIYRLIAKGDCYADTSEAFSIGVENIPAPTITDDLDFPGMSGDTLFLCEYDSNTFYIAATGKDISYRWFWNNLPLDQRDNIQGLGSRFIFNTGWQMSDSGRYKVRVSEECGAYTESSEILIKMRDIPRVTQDPINIDPAVLEGTDVSFWMDATGYALQYQWRKDEVHMVDDTRISGTQTDSLIIDNVIPSDVAFYSCIVTGGCPGFADTTNLAILDLNAAPSILKQPNDTLEICEGSDNVISLVAAGTNLRYRWHWVPDTGSLAPPMFSGADTRLLEITNAQAGYTGYIRCELDNQAGATTLSDIVYFRVIPTPPKPIIQKSGSLLFADQDCETYIWFYNGVWKPQYASKTIKPTEDGDYTVRVLCEGCPSEMSDPRYYTTSIVRANLETLNMYPNPSSELVILDLPGITAENKAVVNIYDLSGKLVKTIDGVDSESFELNVDGLSKGMYVITVHSALKSFSGKLIKE